MKKYITLRPVKIVGFLIILSFLVIACAESQFDTTQIDPAQRDAFMATIQANGGEVDSEMESLIRQAAGMPDEAPPSAAETAPEPAPALPPEGESELVIEPMPDVQDAPESEEPLAEPQEVSEPMEPPEEPPETLIEEEPQPNVSAQIINPDPEIPAPSTLQLHGKWTFIQSFRGEPCSNLCQNMLTGQGQKNFKLNDRICLNWIESKPKDSTPQSEIPNSITISIYNNNNGENVHNKDVPATKGGLCRGSEVFTDTPGNFLAVINDGISKREWDFNVTR